MGEVENQYAKKRATAAGNAKEIAGLKDQLSGMEEMLKTLVGDKMGRSAPGDKEEQTCNGGFTRPEDVSPQGEGWLHGPTRPRGRTRSTSSPRQQHDTQRRADSFDDPRRARESNRRSPETIFDLAEDDDLQKRVSQLLADNLNPISQKNKGRRFFAHIHVVRGRRKTKTGLGELTLAEYNYGLHQMAKLNEGEARKMIIHHLEAVNEDAMTYAWPDVRSWSEEVCTRIYEQRLGWWDETRIEHLRLKLSQVITGRGIDQEQEGQDYKIDPHVAVAKPAPPCRQYNFGNCGSPDDHVLNGYRHLHVCSFCIFSKCGFYKHPEKDCRGKKFKNEKKRQSAYQGNDGRSGGMN